MGLFGQCYFSATGRRLLVLAAAAIYDMCCMATTGQTLWLLPQSKLYRVQFRRAMMHFTIPYCSSSCMRIFFSCCRRTLFQEVSHLDMIRIFTFRYDSDLRLQALTAALSSNCNKK